jgi:hypothetical protein
MVVRRWIRVRRSGGRPAEGRDAEMFSKPRRWLLSFGLSFLCAGPISTVGVTAQTADADNFTFQAISTSMTPMQLVGGTGSVAFSAGFTGATVCTGGSTDSDDLFSDVELPPSHCELYGSATYTNVICGTGFVHGTATVTEYDGTKVSDVYDFSFDITYALGAGTLAGFATERVDGGETSPIAGHVTFAITGVGPPPICATSLTITGTLASAI